MIWFLFISENAFLSVAVTFETVGGGGWGMQSSHHIKIYND